MTRAAAMTTTGKNRIIKSFDDIVDPCCYIWNTLIDQPRKIRFIARRDWAAVGAKTIR
jgi:hypothetical protein